MSLINVPYGLTVDDAYDDYEKFCDCKYIRKIVRKSALNFIDWKTKITMKISLQYTIRRGEKSIIMHHGSRIYRVNSQVDADWESTDITTIISHALCEEIISPTSYVHHGIHGMPKVVEYLMAKISTIECDETARMENMLMDKSPMDYLPADKSQLGTSINRPLNITDVNGKDIDTTPFKKDMSRFNRIIEGFGSKTNHYFDNYCRWYHNNFFELTATDSILYLFPPMIECVINMIPGKLNELKMPTVLIVPDWPDNAGIKNLIAMATTIDRMNFASYDAVTDKISATRIDVLMIWISGSDYDHI